MDSEQLDKPVSGLPQDQEKESQEITPLPSLLTSLIESPSFQKSFSELTTASERIKFVLSHDTAGNMIEQIMDDGSVEKDDVKNGALAAEFGQDGTRAFEALRYEDALLSYSKSIRYAPHDSALLPIAFGNRSSVFFQLMKYEATLKDIDAAQSHPQYKPFFMLTIRKCQCLVRLGRVEQAKNILFAIKRADLNKSDAALLTKFYKQDGEFFKKVEDEEEDIEPELLKNLSSVIKILFENGRFESQYSNSSLSSKVEVRYDEKNGRHLVTTQDVHFGDILAVTKPYASVLTEKQELQFCHHCLVSLKPIQDSFPRSVPCTQCTRVLYCSEYCRNESWKSYHRFECLLFAHSWNVFTDLSLLYLAFRTLFVAGGLESFRAIAHKFKAGDPSKSFDFTHNLMDCYENVYRMAMKEDDSIEGHIKTVIQVISLFKWFKQFGDADIFEGSSPDIAPLENDIYAIETLLRHYQQNRNNLSLFVRCDQSALDNPTASDESITTLDPLISLVRKSCDPNISIIGVDCTKAAPHISNVCVFFVIKPIPAGTMLTSVGPRYGDSVKYRIYLYEFLRSRKESWKKPETDYICPCDHCEDKRRESPLGSIPITTIDSYEFYCGSTCGGFIRRTEDQVKCCTCKRDIGPDELAKLKKICSEISEMHSQAIALIVHIKGLIKNNDKKVRVNLPKELCTSLQQLETFINDRIAPLALVHSRLMLVDLYDQLKDFFWYCFMKEMTRFEHLHKAWKYAENSHTTMKVHFGGDSLGLLRLLQENVRLFSDVISKVRLGLIKSFGFLHAHLSLMTLSENSDEGRNFPARLVDSFNTAQAQLDRMNDCYEMV